MKLRQNTFLTISYGNFVVDPLPVLLNTARMDSPSFFSKTSSLFPEQEGPGVPEQEGPGVPEQEGPGVPEQEGPGVPEQGGPVVPEQGGPRVLEQGGPGVPEQLSPGVPEQGAPRVPEQRGPRVPEQGGPRVSEQGGPRVSEQGGPGVPEQGGPRVPEQGGPRVPEQGGPRVPEQGGPRVPEQGGPRVPELSRVLVNSKAEPLLLQTRRHTRLQRQMLRNASSGLTFSQDVVRDRGPSSLPYSQRDTRGLFDPAGLLGPPARTKQRGALRMDPPRHMPCHLWTEDRAKRRDPDSEGGPRGVPLVSEQCREKEKDKEKGNEQPAVFLTEADSPPRGHVSARKVASLGASNKDGVRGQWDELLLGQISKTTAPGGHKARGQSLLQSSSSTTDQLPEDPMNTEDFHSCRELPPDSGIKTVQKAVPETPLPLYYRAPGFSRAQTQPNEPGGINLTADTLRVKHLQPLPPPRLQDSLNPRAGAHVYSTENPFEQELYSGISSQVHQRDERRRDWIIMENTSEYRKNLQEQFPCAPEQWNKAGGARQTTPKHTVLLRPVKGGRRWLALPSPADFSETGLRPPNPSWPDTRPVHPRTPHRPLQELTAWRYTVDEWRKAWKHMTRWQDVTVEGLKKDLTDMHCHVRVIAIATCASGAVNRPSPELNPSKEALNGCAQAMTTDVQPVPEELQPLLRSALTDPSDRVRFAAALCQYAIGSGSTMAREILQGALSDCALGRDADSWAAAQCLALDGEGSAVVVQRLISQLFDTDVEGDKEQATALLVSLSNTTTVVRSLLVEKLNSRNWRERTLSCHTLARLKSSFNKDLANKLTFLMWNDWHSKVRQAAAQTLGRMGLGKEVHDELRLKLCEDSPCWRVVALSLLAQLGIMTAKLLPAFLSCFNNEFVAVRQQACLTAAMMRIPDELVFNQLLRVMQNEPVKEIKASAIHALGQTSHVTPALREMLLWALHHEEEPVVRFAAGDAIIALRLTGSDLQDLLLDRLSLEPHLLVRRKVAEIQAKLGFSQEGGKNLVHKVKQQVHKLCSKRIITQKVLRLEELEDTLVQKALRIDLRTQPGLSDDPRDIARLLGECFPAHRAPNSAPLQPESELALYDTESQSLSDSFRSSGTATPRTPALLTHDTEDEAKPQRPITRGHAKSVRACGQSHHQPLNGSAVSLSHGQEQVI
ncbi:HEAT repeat-containing protein 4 isoform X2 [Polyodon spathula]|uniref:HEAT repeat-containing protein 4 isoform X2 n=1 Tax=Polyodon spathula TaxID=7913 RepID=UPI001B7F3929|nr:HEAT repeat-containing protein 4 isoform X2 [Polyodon spathula]